MRSFRTVVLAAAFLGGSVLALLRGLARAARETENAGQSSQSMGGKTKHWLRTAAVLLILGGFAGLLVVVSGLVPIKASSGHWKITAWFLNFTMERSVVTHSFMIKQPELDDPALVAQGATQYEFGCRPCHGAPDIPQPVVAQHMTPSPPHLPWVVSQWQPNQLFYIVKHGVKFTGMPAWPAQQRDDEVWAMVAFLRGLPSLTAEEYQNLARSRPTAGAGIDELSGVPAGLRVHIGSCARCHGVDGRGRGLGAFPTLAGQRPVYLAASLLAYARGERYSGIMQPIAAGLPMATINELARYYARLPGGVGLERIAAFEPNPAEQQSAIERGRQIATVGIPRQRLPACAACHGPGPASRNPIYPQLAGQYARYLAAQLLLLKSGDRGGTPYAHIMRAIAARLEPEQINDLALYYASLPPASENPAP